MTVEVVLGLGAAFAKEEIYEELQHEKLTLPVLNIAAPKSFPSPLWKVIRRGWLAGLERADFFGDEAKSHHKPPKQGFADTLKEFLLECEEMSNPASDLVRLELCPSRAHPSQYQ